MGVQINGDTGNISATKADYSGNVTIGGTLTYEDVTNIDSVGLITARQGIEVGARPGVGASISVDGNAIFSGITTATTLRAPTGIVTSLITNTARATTGIVTTLTATTGIVTTLTTNTLTANSTTKVGSGVTLSPDGDVFATGICTATHFSSNSGTTIQRQFKYLTSTSQLAKGGAISELTTDLRIAFTPKFADSNIMMEFDSSFVFPNSSNLQFCLFYDVTNSAGVSIPAAAGNNGSRVHWTNRTSPVDANDNDHISMKIVTPANNTTARTYTIHFGTEGAQAQFFVSTLTGAGAGTVFPMTFIVTEIAA